MSGLDAEGAIDDGDLRRLLVEIDEEVARRRASGEIPPGLERELDATFARFSPPATGGSDAASVLAAVERTAFVDVDVPTESAIPGGPVLKRSLRKVMAWYLRYLAQQTSAFNAAAVRALRATDARLTALERTSPAASPHLRSALDALEPAPVPDEAVALAVDACRGAAGRVLVADVGNGAVVRALSGAGLDAYGVEPRRSAANRALADGLDVRLGDVAEHLAGVARDVLGGVVLTGVVERLPAAGALALAEAAAAALAPGAPLVVVSRTPSAWASGTDPVARDLAPGRPLSAETWSLVLARLGAPVEARHDAAAGRDLVDLPAGVAGADVVNANNATLRALLPGPSSYVLVARRAA